MDKWTALAEDVALGGVHLDNRGDSNGDAGRMRTSWQWRVSYTALKWLSRAALAGITFSSVLQGMDEKTAAGWWPARIPFVKAKAFCAVLAVALAALVLATKIARSMIGHPNTWDQVQAILNQIRDDLFDVEDPPHFHQVTLLKRRTWSFCAGPWRRERWWPWGRGCWIFSGWLIPVARSGHTNKRTRARFLAPDDPRKAEGVAGAAWAIGRIRGAPSKIENLPKLCKTSTPAEKQDYANRAAVGMDWVEWCIREGKSAPRSYYGCTVEVEDKPWGVLVIDSQGETLPQKNLFAKATRASSNLLAAALRGA